MGKQHEGRVERRIGGRPAPPHPTKCFNTRRDPNILPGGLLLHDSVLLCRNGKYASATAIALFAIEEIGRSRLLFRLWEEMVEKGRTFTVQAIRLKCGNHVIKQTFGLDAPIVHIPSGSENKLNRIFQATLVNKPTPESIKASDELHAIGLRLNKKLPTQRHDWRQKSLYVEPSRSGYDWDRPKDQPKRIALHSLLGAWIAYSSHICVFTRTGFCKNADPAFSTAFRAWEKRPELPSRPSAEELDGLFASNTT